MKKYLYFVIPIIILLMMVLAFVWTYPNKNEETYPSMNEEISKIPEVNNENINVIEPEIISPETLENEELSEASESEKVDEVIPKETTSKTTSSSKTTSTSKKKTLTESVKKEETKVDAKVEEKEETKVDVKVEDKKEETKPSLPQTTEPTTSKQDSSTSNDNNKSEEVKKEETVVRCTTDHNHSIGVGNCGKWFNSASEGIAEYNSIISDWGTKWENFEIDNDTYYAKCPSGYQYIDCMYCGKYTFDYYYRVVDK